MNPLLIDAPYSVTQLIDNMVIYQTCRGTDELLDLIRLIQESGNYFWQAEPFPASKDISVAANTTLNGSIVVPPETIITSINFYSAQAAGFKIKLYDKGTKASIFYGEYALERLVASNMQIGQTTEGIFGQGYLMSPFIVTPPGILGWEVVNQATVANVLQVMINCAIPITPASIGHRVVDKVAA